MSIYSTTVYHVNEFTGSTVSDLFNIPLTRLHRNEIEELDEKSAAAQAWIEAVGQFRIEKLEALGVSQAIKDMTESKSFVVGHLVPFPICVNAQAAFVFDNTAEAWIIAVNSPGSIFLDS